MDVRLEPPLIIHTPDLSAELRARIDALNDEAWPLRFVDQARARGLATQALELAESVDYPVGVALALRTLAAQDHYFHADYDGALRLLERAQALLDAAGEARGRADVLNGIGNVYVRHGRHDDAVRLHLEALALQREAGDRLGEGNSLSHLGNASYLIGEYGRALEHHQAALALREQIGDRGGVGYSLINVGIIHGQMGEPERVIEYMTRALAIHEGADPHGAAICLSNIGNAWAELGDYERAQEYLERAAEGLGAAGVHDDASSCLCDLGRLHERRGELARALDCYQRAVERVQHTGARIYETEALAALGALQVRMGDADVGLENLHRALASAESRAARQQVYAAHEALAQAYERLGDTGRALEHYRAFHSAWREVFSTETNARIKSLLVRAEVQQAQREAEILRERNDALTRADEEKARLLEQLQLQATELERQTRQDALTGLSNRRHLDTLLAVERERALRFGRALTVAMADLDHFKQVNDRFSHVVGDEVLRTVARILREHVRGVDVVARYGGEEFCLILVETGAEEAARLCDRLRELVQAHDWSAIRPGLAVTISMGVAELTAASQLPDALLAAADTRLYAAKRAGRNRVCL